MRRRVAMSVQCGFGWFTLAMLAVVGGGCRGAAERCAEEQAAAAQLWQRYAGELAAERDRLREQLEDVVNQDRVRQRGLSALASQQADRLNRPGTSAWHRTYRATLQVACTRDDACMNLRVRRRNLDRELARVGTQLEQARAALRSSGLGREVAQRAVLAVEEDFARSVFKQARARSERAFEACEGVPAPAQ